MSTEIPNLDSIFCSAIEIAAEADRVAYVAQACGDDDKLKGQVEKLVAAHFEAGSFLERPAVALAVTDVYTPDPAGANQVGKRESVGTLIGPYKLLQQIGEGGMGTVYMAEDVRLGRKAAIKTMKRALAVNPENRVRFVREARAAAAVEHDNIVPIWQVGEAADGSPFIAMPFLQGETLEARLQREPIPPLGLLLKVACEVAEGLAAAHAQGLIHRDIKPGNVWLEGDPQSADLPRQVRRCKILDFGLARSVATEDVQVTASGTILGTPGYMAPEQASGKRVDHRTDLFSLGVMLFRMSTGESPFARENVMAVLYALATVTPPPARTRNRDLPQSLSDLIDRLLNKDAADRPQSAADVAAAVRRIQEEWRARESVLAGAPRVTAPASLGQTARKDRSLTAMESEGTVPVETRPAPRAAAKAGRGRTALLVALGLLALGLLGWWLAPVILRVESADGTLVVEIDDPETEARIQGGKLILTGPDDKVRYTLSPSERDKKIEAGPYKVRVEGADGLTVDTPEFTLKKGGKVTVRVTVEPRAAAKGLDPDRQAAEWVLSIGGRIRVNGQDRWLEAVADLPPEAFQLTWIGLTYNKQVSDAGLAHCKDCKNLLGLALEVTSVSDTGLAYFKNCKGLLELHLGGAQVSDTGLAYFKDCKSLVDLRLGRTQVSDAGLAHFKGCKNLTVLDLGGTTKVSDAGVAHFKDCKSLKTLWLGETQVSDTGLAYFQDCKSLTDLSVQKTKVTAAKVEELKKALPRCRIQWDGM